MAKKRKEVEEIKSRLKEVEEGQQLLETLHQLTLDPDPELRDLAHLDLPSTTSTLSSLRSSLFSLLLPPSPADHLSALIEIKSGVGGSESSLFVGELLRTYQKLATRRGWRNRVVESVPLGGVSEGFREVMLEVRGEDVFGKMRGEAGVHRVQRVPVTESQGRVHTSTVAVIVLPLEEENTKDEGEPLYDPKDVKVEVMRSRGAGGQHVNKTESAIRLTHLPTGTTVSMQDSRSQHENRAKAYLILRSRLLSLRLSSLASSRRNLRLSQVSSTDRSEKIRTYNFPQGRVTDHRLTGRGGGGVGGGLEEFLEGGEGWDWLERALKSKEEEEALGAALE